MITWVRKHARSFFTCFGAALFLMFAVSQFVSANLGQSAIRHNADYQTKVEKERSETAIQNCTGQRPLPVVRDCENQARETSRNTQHDIDDLEAQQLAALWNGVIGITALVGMFVGIVGVVLVATTFWETRRGNEISRELGEAQTRCYLSPVKAALVYEGDCWKARCFVKNSGQSPALSVDWTGYLGINNGTARSALECVERFPGKGRLRPDIPSGGEEGLSVIFFELPLNDGDRECVERGEKVFFHLAARVIRTDVFNKTDAVQMNFTAQLDRFPGQGGRIDLESSPKYAVSNDA